MRKTFFAFLAIGALLASLPALAAPDGPPRLAKKAHESEPSPYFLDANTVVQVICEKVTGTAFHIGGGRFVTARHVVAGQSQCTIGDKPLTIVNMGKTSNSDYAVVRADFFPEFAVLVSCARFQEGDETFTTGYAQGAPWPVTTRGRATNLRYSDDHTLVVRGSSVAGMSGGPVSDRDGAIHALEDWSYRSGAPGSGVVELADTPVCKR